MSQVIEVAQNVGQMAPGDLLRTAEVADLTGIPQETLRWWRHVQRGPRSFKLGRRVVYRRQDVEGWIQAQYQETVVG